MSLSGRCTEHGWRVAACAAVVLAGALSAGASAADPHAAHRAAAQQEYRVVETEYRVPAVVLVDRARRPVAVDRLLATRQPVIVQFIFTTCPTICPVLTGSLAGARPRLKADGRAPLLVSVTIDPEHDRPAVLSRYARQFDAGERWRFLTGDRESVRELQRAFDAYYGDRKMYHQPVTLMRPGRDAAWRRIEGLPSARELLREYRRMMGAPSDAPPAG